jgi:chromosome segregation ATPase
MEETKSRPGAPSERAQIAAEKLRALRERANEALDEHRRRLSQIESELGLRIRQLAEEFETASANAHRQGVFGRDDEVAALRRQLEEGRAKHEKFVEQLAFARRQLDAIQSQPCSACHDAAQQIAEAHGEIRQLREKLDAADRHRHEDRTRHEKLATQIAEAREKLAELQSNAGANSSELHDEIATLKGQLEEARVAKANAEAEAAVLERDAAALSAEYDSLQLQSTQLEAKHAQALAEAKQAADGEAAALNERIADLDGKLKQAAAKQDSFSNSIKSLEAKLSEADKRDAAFVTQREAWSKERTSLEAALAEAKTAANFGQQSLSTDLAAAKAEVAKLSAALTQAEAGKAAAEAALSEAKSQASGLEASLVAVKEEVAVLKAAEAKTGERYKVETAELTARVKQLETEKSAAEASLADIKEQSTVLRDSLTSAQEQLESLKAGNANAAELQKKLDDAVGLVAKRDETIDELKASGDAVRLELVDLRESTCPRAELDDLEHKFQLALADVQKLRQENGELREELATRPEASDAESPELVAIRAERDMLEARVAELEAATTAAAAAPGQQELEDLHRRFEMAVEDVRELKQENAKLRDQLAKAKPAVGGDAPAASGKLDWAAQKARLLATLAEEEGDGPIDHDRKKERLSIQDTIEATERALAEKEQELAELREATEEADANRGPDLREQTEAILNADEIIAQERERLTQLQAEWEQKVRTAELEMSIERAKLAREQAALKERIFELEKLAPQSADESGKPRRRWLSALGLHDDAEDASKKPR